MNTMSTKYTGALTVTNRKDIDWYLDADTACSVRNIASHEDLPYGQVRGYVEWRRDSLEDLFLPPPADKPAILLFDIETTPAEGKFWGKRWKTNILEVTQESYTLCAGYEWLGHSEVGFFSIFEDPNYKPYTTNDIYAVKRIWRLLDQADIVIAHNGDTFDIKKSNTRFLKHGLGPPSPYQTVDTLKESRRYFSRESHSLGDITASLELATKFKDTNFQLWLDCIAGDPVAWATMEVYNRQDVVALREWYLTLREWIGSPGKRRHPNLGHWNNSEKPVCPNCGHDRLWVRGYWRSSVSEFAVLRCHKKSGGCGSYHNSRTRERQLTDADRVHLV